MDHTLTRQKIKELRTLVAESDRIAVVLQDDPDPDAMSSAIALRALLFRSFGTITSTVTSMLPVVPSLRRTPLPRTMKVRPFGVPGGIRTVTGRRGLTAPGAVPSVRSWGHPSG